mmetsp:Transcript_9791/g.21163  ORF Transcript_9791/g.21163 Transcript_9791/m.21163 type:complete len:189 (-) Transcript_9791:272-838(-)|eukprot:CAMPEP_0168805652 /NCGR_PEP_ID=MMETSP0726-20121227/1140_1 /TAXON_ID=265536 /ORGANISM="Amphiprora sp., Strain CCMP467" /LENGTH=188 /DNA_ID=CAMNT_0008857531 /DNA_START=241 /DNA_END=807 /DNA_ORIENTATION=-
MKFTTVARLFRRSSNNNYIDNDDDETQKQQAQHRLSLSSRRRRMEGKHPAGQQQRRRQRRQEQQQRQQSRQSPVVSEVTVLESEHEEDDSCHSTIEVQLVRSVSRDDDQSRGSRSTTIIRGRGAIRFDMGKTQYYTDDLRNMTSPLEWNQCWYYPETIEEFRADSRRERAAANTTISRGEMLAEELFA